MLNYSRTDLTKPAICFRQIAADFGLSIRRIRQALELFQIQKRSRPRKKGKYGKILKAMAVGETGEPEYPAEHPSFNFHTFATRPGIKISFRKATGGGFINPAAQINFKSVNL